MREAQANAAVLARTRNHLLVFATVAVCAAALSLAHTLSSLEEQYEGLALAAARSFFREVVVTRRWNVLHGGVYVPVTPATPPNPYLQDARREVVTTDGLRLAKLNPAYMTRLISEVMREEEGTQFHITSLKPIRPENGPDAWERTALEAFEQGAAERFALVGSGAGALLRYIAPLKTEDSCLPCHAQQGYARGDIRGGISVSVPYAPFSAALRRQRRSTAGAHALVLLLGLGFVFVLGRHLLARIRQLQESSAHIRTLEGLLPICSGCKKIRKADADPRDERSWEPIERYIHERTDADFTHGYCPECAKKYFGQFAED